MIDDIHDRTVKLIDKMQVEGLTMEERDDLEAHLDCCVECRQCARETETAIARLRSAVPRFDLSLTLATQLRARIRARQLVEDAARRRALWISCTLSWVLGVVSAPLLWRGCAWIGHRLAISTAAWVTGFALLWVAPAVFAAAVIAWRHAQQEQWRGTSDK